MQVRELSRVRLCTKLVVASFSFCTNDPVVTDTTRHSPILPRIESSGSTLRENLMLWYLFIILISFVWTFIPSKYPKTYIREGNTFILSLDDMLMLHWSCGRSCDQTAYVYNKIYDWFVSKMLTNDYCSSFSDKGSYSHNSSRQQFCCGCGNNWKLSEKLESAD
jgi:hypothetical protein